MIDPNSNVLILKVNRNIPREQLDALYFDIYEQMKKGLVLLPYFVDPIVVPKDIEVLVEKHDGEIEPPEEEELPAPKRIIDEASECVKKFREEHPDVDVYSKITLKDSFTGDLHGKLLLRKDGMSIQDDFYYGRISDVGWSEFVNYRLCDTYRKLYRYIKKESENDG